MSVVVGLFERGGPVMWPLLLCSLISMTLTIERIIFWWRMRHSGAEGVEKAALDSIAAGQFERALAALGSERSANGRVIRSGIEDREHGYSEAMEIQAGKEIEQMKRGLGVLDTIVTMAPLLGILGTVLGIIESFDLLGASGIQDPKSVTAGISQALITTAAGLTVALVTLVPLNYFIARTQRAAKELEHTCKRLEVSLRGRSR